MRGKGVKFYLPFTYKYKIFFIFGWITAWFRVRLYPVGVSYGLVRTSPVALELGGNYCLEAGGRFVSKSSAKFVEPRVWHLVFRNKFLSYYDQYFWNFLASEQHEKLRYKITCAWSDTCCAFMPLAHLVSFLSFANFSVLFIKWKLKFQAVGSLPEWIYHLCSFLWWWFWTKCIYDNTPDCGEIHQTNGEISLDVKLGLSLKYKRRFWIPEHLQYCRFKVKNHQLVLQFVVGLQGYNYGVCCVLRFFLLAFVLKTSQTSSQLTVLHLVLIWTVFAVQLRQITAW